MILNPRAGPDRHVRLIQREQGFWLIPAGNLPEFQDFPLPRLPLSLAQSLVDTADRFYHQQKGCLALTLLVDPIVRRWTVIPPTQSCGRNRANWQDDPNDYLDGGNAVLAGSFQTARLSSVFEAAERVPPQDGLHLICPPTAPLQLGRIFLRSLGQVVAADPGSVLIDEAQDLLLRYRDRLLG